MKDWTIMVYMAGDNNLSVDMAYALQQIKDIVKENNDSLNLFVYYDGYSPAIPTLYCDFSDPENPHKYYRSHKIENKLFDVKPEFDENSAMARSVINFVDWCVNKVEYKEDDRLFYGRKATNYALIFSGHSFGFQSIGFMKDEKSNYYMTLPKLNWLLERITQTEDKLLEIAKTKQKEKSEQWDDAKLKSETTEILGKKLEILGFDSCVMSMLEVGYQFNSVANTMIASEGSLPNAGWSYAQILGNLTGNSTGFPVNDIAKQFVKTFILRQDKYTLGEISVDMAAWDLNVLHEIETPFKNLAENLLECFKDPASTIYKQMNRVILQTHWKCQSFMMEQNIDLGDFCQLLIDEIKSLKDEFADNSFEVLDKIIESCDEVLKHIRKCIILSGFSGGKYQYSNGISLFFPWSLAGYNISKKNYNDLIFIRNTEAGKKWNSFISKYVSEISFRKAKEIKENEETGITYYSYTYEDKSKAPDQASSIVSEIPSSGIIKGNFVLGENTDNTNMVFENLVFEKNVGDGTHRVPENGTHRVPENGTHRIPENGTHKMFGVLGLYLAEFMNYKNIQTFWNLSGFTKTDSNLKYEIRHNLTGTNIHTPPG